MEKDLVENVGIPAGKRPKFRWFILASAVAAIAVAAVWLETGGLSATTPPSEPPARSASPRVMQLSILDVVTVQPTSVEDTVKATGQVLPFQEAAISAQVSGLAERVTVRPGDVVSKGALLASIGTADLQLLLDQQRNAVDSTRAQLDGASASLARTEALANKGLSAQTELDAARSNLKQLNATLATQESQVKSAEFNLARARILAPFDGVVATRTIEPGQTVSSGTPILSIVDMSRVRVELLVPLRNAARIAAGQTVDLTVQGIADQTFKGVVDRINPIAEEGTRSVKAYMTLDNADRLLRGGMVATADIVVDRLEAAMMIPKAAVRSEDDKSYVLAIVDGRLEERPVTTGDAWGADLVQVLSGLANGDTIVASNLSGLAPGEPVSIEGN